MIMHSSVVLSYRGSFAHLPMTITFKDSDGLEATKQFFQTINLLVGEDDPITPRLIPECVDEETGQFVFFKDIGNYGLRIPVVEDVGACYFDEHGIPSAVKNYYQGIGMIPYGISDPITSALEIFTKSFDDVKTINIFKPN